MVVIHCIFGLLKQLSQFWYTPETSEQLAKIARSQGLNICCLSSPTAFKALYDTRQEGERLVLLEFDKRYYTGNVYSNVIISLYSTGLYYAQVKM